MKFISSIASIFDNYDAFILDLWGVIHDGSQAYPNVYDTLVKLRLAGKKIIFLSNAPRRAARAAAVLEQLGIESALYDHIVTSGEVGYEWLIAGNAPWGNRYYFIGAQKDEDLLYSSALSLRGGIADEAIQKLENGLPQSHMLLRNDEKQNFKQVYELKDADFILNLGFGSDEQTAADFSLLLELASEKKLPMLCLNPDFEVVKISGERFPCAGVIAKNYEEIGGKVTYFGKPYQQVYEHCHKLLGESSSNLGVRHCEERSDAAIHNNNKDWIASASARNDESAVKSFDKRKILAIGDSLDTDIMGAKNFGVDSMLVTGGILRDKTIAEIEEICVQSSLRPNFIIPKFG